MILVLWMRVQNRLQGSTGVKTPTSLSAGGEFFLFSFRATAKIWKTLSQRSKMSYLCSKRGFHGYIVKLVSPIYPYRGLDSSSEP